MGSPSTAPATRHGAPPAGRLRLFAAWLFLFGAAGTLGELVLLEHTESLVQWLPLVAVAAGAATVVWALARPAAAALRAVQGTGALIAVVGAVGVGYHYSGNEAFELEMSPESGGWTLVWDSLTGATPALAPGLMVQLGLLGMAFTYRHPALSGPSYNEPGDPT
ncbi:MAG: hypothetical protein P8177_04865 [Gemmatimonadota bacterium]|jgi:hypothetical protein